MRFRTASILYITFLSIFCQSTCFAYNTGIGGHSGITKRAYSLAEDENPGYVKNIDKGILTAGAVAEDEESKVNPLSHFYNPATGMGLFGILESAKHKAARLYERKMGVRSCNIRKFVIRIPHVQTIKNRVPRSSIPCDLSRECS